MTKGAEQQTHDDAPVWHFGGEYAFANRRASRSVGNWNDTHPPAPAPAKAAALMLLLLVVVASSARAIVATQLAVATL